MEDQNAYINVKHPKRKLKFITQKSSLSNNELKQHMMNVQG